MTLSAISLDDLKAPAVAPDDTPAPELRWLPIASLRIDDTYQRAITKAGRASIAKIAAGFDWRFFAPVVVSPVEGGLFAIVDGQHRATAAALIGKTEAPCSIVLADRRTQARAFSAVNGNVTRMSALAVFRARVGAGDPEACELMQLCESVGVRILAYPNPVAKMRNGDCTAPAVLVQAKRRFGAAILRQALAAIMAPGRDARGLVNPFMVRGLCMAFERLPKPMATENVGRIFAAIDLAACGVEARKYGYDAAEELASVVLRKLAAIAARGKAARA